ncbi:unnamed protein product [Didymodactylos carnosus]|uniref:Uncharacterized protein n=1 Tax=Didymodactylos carnosus TaxID=1234261 RepID=A0A815IJN2_9BILA|nr:unnamed protein product [Didymodactylos carnosus]CAF4249705.1 unnamed protein product [Didymodactylos carnosus]
MALAEILLTVDGVIWKARGRAEVEKVISEAGGKLQLTSYLLAGLYAIDKEFQKFAKGEHGVADAIGASVKRMFDDIIRFHPDETYKNAGELMRNVQNSTSIRFYLYAKEDIDAIRQQIPLLTSIRGTSLFHEIIAHPDGKIFAKSKSDDEEKLIKTNF